MDCEADGHNMGHFQMDDIYQQLQEIESPVSSLSQPQRHYLPDDVNWHAYFWTNLCRGMAERSYSDITVHLGAIKKLLLSAQQSKIEFLKCRDLCTRETPQWKEYDASVQRVAEIVEWAGLAKEWADVALIHLQKSRADINDAFKRLNNECQPFIMDVDSIYMPEFPAFPKLPKDFNSRCWERKHWHDELVREAEVLYARGTRLEELR